MFLVPHRGLAGMGDVTTTDANSLQSITDLIRDGLTFYNQQQILQANIDRQRAGLPPINTAAIAPTYNVGLSADTKNMMIMGGLGLMAVVLLGRSKS